MNCKSKAPALVLLRAGVGIATTLLLGSNSALFAQGGPGFELPEYYGLYALVDGRLLGISVPVSSVSPQQVAVRLIQDFDPEELSSVDIPELPNSVEFLMFHQSEGLVSSLEAATEVEIAGRPFVRRTQEKGPLERVNGNYMVTTKKVQVNSWLLGYEPTLFGGTRDQREHDHYIPIVLLHKPVEGHPDLTVSRPAARLQPGVYVLTWMFMDQSFLFAVPLLSQGEIDRCIDADFKGGTIYETRPCGELPASPPPAPTDEPPAVGPPTDDAPSPEVGCSNFRSCLVAASSSFKAGRLQQALAEAERASTLEPSDSKSWGLMGDVLLNMGRYSQVAPMWDKFLQLGGEGTFGMCRGKSMLICFPGTLTLSKTEISFLNRKNEAVFEGEVSRVEATSARKVDHANYEPSTTLTIRMAGKKYNLDPIPNGASDCVIELASYVCPDPGSSQQALIADYLATTVSQLADGSSPILAAPPETSGMTAQEKEKWLNFIAEHTKAIMNIPEPKDDWFKIMFAEVSGKWDSYQSLYLSGVNRRNIASEALSSARAFLETEDTEETEKYANLSVKYLDQSNQLFSAAETAYARGIESVALRVEAVYEVSTLIAKYGLTVASACGPTCYDMVEWVVLVTNHGVDSAMRGEEEALKQTTSAILAKLLLDSAEVSALMENLSKQFLGVAGADRLVQQALASPALLEASQKALAEAGTGVSSDVLNKAIGNIMDVASDGFTVAPSN